MGMETGNLEEVLFPEAVSAVGPCPRLPAGSTHSATESGRKDLPDHTAPALQQTHLSLLSTPTMQHFFFFLSISFICDFHVQKTFWCLSGLRSQPCPCSGLGHCRGSGLTLGPGLLYASGGAKKPLFSVLSCFKNRNPCLSSFSHGLPSVILKLVCRPSCVP